MIHYFRKILTILIAQRYRKILKNHRFLRFLMFPKLLMNPKIQKNLKFRRNLKNPMFPQDFHP
jgi:hypothetical protein